MNYSGIIYNDTANGCGWRTSLFVSGCRLHCKDCFNPEAQDFNFGKPFTETNICEIIESVNGAVTRGITILGGEPMEPENARDLLPLVEAFNKKIRGTKNMHGKEKDIWIYTGYKYEFLMSLPDDDDRKKLLMSIDILVDGPFEKENYKRGLLFRGSTNQRIISMKESKEKYNYETPVDISEYII